MGSNENDLLIGGFAERYLGGFSEAQIERFEALIREGDNDLFNWITGKEAAPGDYDHDVMDMLKFYVQNEAARS